MLHYNINIALDSGTDSSKMVTPLLKCRGDTVKSKKGMHTKRSLKGTYVLVYNYTR